MTGPALVRPVSSDFWKVPLANSYQRRTNDLLTRSSKTNYYVVIVVVTEASLNKITNNFMGKSGVLRKTQNDARI